MVSKRNPEHLFGVFRRLKNDKVTSLNDSIDFFATSEDAFRTLLQLAFHYGSTFYTLFKLCN